MVRLLCQSCPRSCCDEGEKVDQNRAEKAVTALYSQEAKMTFGTLFTETENSNDSISNMETGSEEPETDSDTEQLFIDVSEGSNSDNSNNDDNRSGPVQVEKRKQRRRERNRRSAQAYRQRRRQQTQKTDEILHELLEKNHLLRENITKLEEEKTFILDILKTKIKIPWPYPVLVPCPTPVWTTPDATMSAPMGMDSVVHEVTVAS